MNETIAAKYRKNRKEGVHAKNALVWARHVSPSYDWKDAHRMRDGYKQFTTEQEGFTIHVCAKYDNSGDSFHLNGHFSDKYKEGCLLNPEARRNSRVFKYFHPEVTYNEHHSALRSMFGKHEAHTLARSYVLGDLKRALTMGNDWNPIDICVTVSREGVELAEHCTGGFSTEDSEENLSEYADNMIAEALVQAKEKLAALCKQPAQPCNCHG